MFRNLYDPNALGASMSLLPAPMSSPHKQLQKDVTTAQSNKPMTAFLGHDDSHDASYYVKCIMGGILSCGITHTAITPLDIVKCRMQTNPELYPGVISGFGTLAKQGGFTIGWAPTFIGYSMQGFCKFGFYEIFKDVYSGFFDAETAFKWRTGIFLCASASAEFIADIALCPMEAVKVRMQTSRPEANFPTNLKDAVSTIKTNEGMNGFFKGIFPLWGRQIPYTMVKFAAFEKVVEAFYTFVFTAPKESYSKGTQLGVTFASGYTAGVLCAIVSQAPDTIVSKLNQNPTGGIGAIIKEHGLVNLALSGLVPRILMIGTLTGLQWWIYDSFKTLVGLKTTGGKAGPVKN